MGRKPIDPNERKQQVLFMTETKKFKLVGKERCQQLASEAVDKEYDSLTTPKGDNTK